MHVVATAGHVDHGKSTLVRALTGMEPDRWAEERRRGMTIDLGFAWSTLPSGQVLAFVDVPGHARFAANMLAGVGPAPAVLVVVAADEGWQAQSEEHLAAIDALGVAHGLLAVTRSDLADAGPASRHALDRIAATSLGRVEAVAVSGTTGAGLPELRAALDRVVTQLPVPAIDGRVRLWVDRAFSIRGSGTVVTGTLGAGSLLVGGTLSLGDQAVRIRGLQRLGEPAEQVQAVARVAVNLRGVDLDDIARGDALLTPAAWVHAGLLDVRLRGTPTGDLPRQLVLHIGSAAVPVHVRPLGEDTARLTLTRSLPVAAGDRALLRDPGAHRVAAGVTVLDAAPPELARRGAARRRAAALESAAAVDPVGEVLRRGVASRRELALLGVLSDDAPAPEGLVEAAGHLVAPEVWVGWREALRRGVDAHARARTLDGGLPEDAARRLLAVPDPALFAALVADCPGVQRGAGRLRLAGSAPELPPAVLAALEAVRGRLAGEPFAALEQSELTALGLTPPVLSGLARAGLLLRVAGVFLLPGAEDEAVRRLAALPQPFTASQARQALATSRRVAIPLLEHLDGQRRTRRVDGNHRSVIR